jgi:hypothetical protein
MDHAGGGAGGPASESTYWLRWSASVTSRRLALRIAITREWFPRLLHPDETTIVAVWRRDGDRSGFHCSEPLD